MTASEGERAQLGTASTFDADVVIVGYGPVGQSLAALLGRAGHRVIVCERRAARYETPRAGHFDHEIMRVFQAMGIADEVRQIADPARVYQFLDSNGTVISQLPRDWVAPSGWDASYHFYQPELEQVVDAAVGRTPSVDVRLNAAVADLRQEPDHVIVILEDGTRLAARYVVGADGANSLVRTRCGIGTEDLGFRGDWLVVDVRPKAGAPRLDIPDTGQVLNPARPNHMGRVAQRYFRWEFMLVDGDDPRDMVKPERVWALLEPWTGPEQAELIRQTVYQFRSIVADDFRRESVLLAGDAAHLMPPFLGQGMSSGIRDAATLSWMLHLVLTGVARPRLLDLYTASRRPQVLAYVEESVKVGTVVCETDPDRAAARREAMRSATELPPPFQPPIGGGFMAGQPLSGRLAVQPFLRTGDGKVRRSDELFGYGFTLLSLIPLKAAEDDIDQLRRTIGLRSIVVGSADIQEDGRALQEWLRSAGVVAALVRPDFYVFGTAADDSEVPALLASLGEVLALV